MAREHLNTPGVLALNIARTRRDSRLLNALVATLQEVFPSVFLLDLHHGRNTIAVATQSPATISDFMANIGHIESPVLRLIARRARDMLRVPTEAGLVLTDDRAPVGRLMDLLVVREVLAANRSWKEERAPARQTVK